MLYIASLCVWFESYTNMQCILIWEVMLYKFENICCVKGEGAVYHSIVTKWFKIFHSGGKNLSNQARLGQPKTVVFEEN